MAGAHLDSVPAGPGINDNGSGSAALLDVAQQMAKSTPQNTVRFAWWGAEELGLHRLDRVGRAAHPGRARRDRAVPQLRHDRLAELLLRRVRRERVELRSPRGGARRVDRHRADASRSSTPCSASRTTTRRSADAATTRRSSTTASRPVACSPVPSKSKTAQQQAIWGGVAGEQFDPCYHLACDTIDNFSEKALDVNSDAVAYAVSTYAALDRERQRRSGREDPGQLPGSRAGRTGAHLRRPAGRRRPRSRPQPRRQRVS